MKVACILITHFAMKAELRRHPEFWGTPVIITKSSGSRQLVLDRSSQVKGVAIGMPLQEALSRSKNAVLLEADESYYLATFGDIADSLEQCSPLLEVADLGCLYVGLDGLEAMYGGEARLITSLLQAVPMDFGPRVGVAEGKFPAYIAAGVSRAGQATKVPEDVAGFLKDFSVNWLPLSWEDKARLHQFGLNTLGQIAELPPGPIQAQFGSEGRLAWELANGIDRSPLLPRQCQEVVSEALTFPSPVVALSGILVGVETLLARALARPEVRGRYVRSVLIEGQILYHPPWIKQLAFKEAIRDRHKVLFVIQNALESDLLPGPLEDIRLTLLGFASESGIQSSLFSDVRKKEQLREAIRQLEARLGGKLPIYQVRDMEPWSRIPERRQMLTRFDP